MVDGNPGSVLLFYNLYMMKLKPRGSKQFTRSYTSNLLAELWQGPRFFWLVFLYDVLLS